MTGTCMQHNVDIDHLKTVESLKQREELKTKIHTSRMQTLLEDNQKLHTVPSGVVGRERMETALPHKKLSGNGVPTREF